MSVEQISTKDGEVPHASITMFAALACHGGAQRHPNRGTQAHEYIYMYMKSTPKTAKGKVTLHMCALRVSACYRA